MTALPPTRPILLAAALLALLGLQQQLCAQGSAPGRTAAALAAEGPLAPHLRTPVLELTKVFGRERFPNVAVCVDGSVLVTYGSSRVRARRSLDGGRTWSSETIIAKGFQAGGVTVDETTGHVIAFIEDGHPPAPLRIYRSTDHGATFHVQDTVVGKDPAGNVPSMHMNDHGITLRRGKHRGRLVRPSRWYAGRNDSKLWPEHYTNAIFSDDGGKTWKASAPFPARGTGEATIAELSDGTLYYNSRRHWAEEGANPRRRWTATSKDGGATWTNLRFCAALPDGPQDSNYGCMAGLARLPIAGRDILLYSNCDSERGRQRGTVWASFDGGRTWPLKRLLFEGAFAYSSLEAGRPGTPSSGLAFVHFEGGPKGGSTVARFNLAWVLGGEKTGDGEVPRWVRP